MATKRYFSILALVLVGLSACGEDPEPPVDAGRGAEVETEAGADGQAAPAAARPGTLFTVEYRIIGTPVVGSPVSIDLEIDSAVGDAPIEIGYQIPDPSALAMDEAQPRTLTRTPQAGEQRIRERVTVIPQREGRLFFNVRVSRSSEDGSASTMISVPLHVGDVATSPQE